jgi:D-alanyl-D-alanine carboxypeptidase
MSPANGGDPCCGLATLAGDHTNANLETEMLEFTRSIRLSRVPHPRALAPLLASAIGAIGVVALLGGHGGTQPSVPVPITQSPHGRCAPGTGPASIGSVASAMPAPQSAIGGVLDAALRAARSHTHAPAATAAVVVCGRVVWADATGVLDLRSQRRANNRSMFILNSAAKTVLATMVMLEIQDGHLRLGTRLSQFYPWLPNARQISVRMLLNMTSGLPDYLYNRRIDWMMDHRPRHHWTVDQVLTGLGTGLGTPKFPPGREYQYSDTNYILLGAILERITHRSIERDFQQLIAGPLGITSATFVPTPPARARMAHPYLLYRNGSLASRWIPGFGVSSAVWGPVFTDGGLASSALDLAWFGNALLGGRLVSATAVRQMTHIGRGDYGFGMRGRSFDGHLWLGHRGYFGGFEAEDWSDPSRQLTIAVATNLQIVGGQPTSTDVWTSIARAYDRQNPVGDQAPVR